MRLWNWRPTAASMDTQAMSLCVHLSLHTTSLGLGHSICPRTWSLGRLHRAVGHYDGLFVCVLMHSAGGRPTQQQNFTFERRKVSQERNGTWQNFTMDVVSMLRKLRVSRHTTYMGSNLPFYDTSLPIIWYLNDFTRRPQQCVLPSRHD